MKREASRQPTIDEAYKRAKKDPHLLDGMDVNTLETILEKAARDKWTRTPQFEQAIIKYLETYKGRKKELISKIKITWRCQG